ncbi:uncharacterized protein LOC105220941 [Zeugodacus cucurbitae]|uniref:uncharacterized protein LOC105220941 n=1 Tax=Zeugodacus cucurbitae TaxID=28588 RepID=UPI000596AB93|nr:uncharacterized protein LOC105220941 [Zeugodacus cucurbitae]
MANQCVLIFICLCSIALVAALPLQDDSPLQVPQEVQATVLSRHARSPDGSVGVDVNQDGASAHYNQNIYSSDDGNFKVDAQAQATHDFHSNDNSFGGSISGSYSW